MGALPRTPTILGWAGFDGGSHRAISFARSPKRDPDDPIVTKFCHDAWGDTLPVVLTQPTSCGCYTLDLVSYYIATFTGISGIFNAIWAPGTVDWRVVVGSVSEQKYNSGCVTPDGAPVVSAALLIISCNPTTGVLVAQITGGNAAIFSSGGFIDTTMNNINTCDGGNAGHLGTLHVSTP